MTEALFTLLRIHLTMPPWLPCWFAFLAALSISVHLLLHYGYGDAQRVFKKIHH